MKLTIRSIATIEPPSTGQAFVWDDDLAGFGLRVLPSGVKSFVVQYRNADGVSRRATIGKSGTVTPEEARKIAKKWFADVAAGHDPAEARVEQRKAMTVKELCDLYMDDARRGLVRTRKGVPKKASTLYNDQTRIRRHIVPLLGKHKVRDLTVPIINGFVGDVQTGKTGTGGDPVANSVLGLLGGMLAYAVSLGVITINPARGVNKAAVVRREVRLSADQYKALGAALVMAEHNGEPWQQVAAIRLLALSGCRLREVTALRRAETALVGNRVRFLRLEETKTGRSARALGDAAVLLLEDIPAAGEIVFPGRDPAKPINNIYSAWTRFFGAVPELKGLTPHGLRHAFASIGDDLGYSESTVGALLGHAKTGVTSNYIHKVDDALVSAATRISGWIAGAMGLPTGEAAPRPVARRRYQAARALGV